MSKVYWITDNRFKFIAMFLFVMWFIFITFLYFKAETLATDPCTACAERLSEDIICQTTGSTYFAQRTYYQNGSVYDVSPGKQTPTSNPQVSISVPDSYQGPVQPGVNESHFRETGESISDGI